MAKKIKTKRQKKKVASVQSLLGIKSFTEYGLLTNNGELLFYLVTPTNISVLSAANIEIKIRQLMFVLSAIPDIEIVCTDSSECFDDNKAYLYTRMETEQNKKVKAILKKDIQFLDEIQTELTTARQFLFIARCKGMTAKQVFAHTNNLQKIISEQGFELHRLSKREIKRFIALYFDATLYGEQTPDVDGGQYFEYKESECVKH